MSTPTAPLIQWNLSPAKLYAIALLNVLDGEKDHNIIDGKSVIEGHRILHARDVALYHHGKDWNPANPPMIPFKANMPGTLEQSHYVNEMIVHEAANAFGDINSGYYTDADRRYIYFEMERRGIEVPDYVAERMEKMLK